MHHTAFSSVAFILMPRPSRLSRCLWQRACMSAWNIEGHVLHGRGYGDAAAGAVQDLATHRDFLHPY